MSENELNRSTWVRPGDLHRSGLDRVRYGVRSHEKRETHLLVVDETAVRPGGRYPPHVLQPKRHADVLMWLFGRCAYRCHGCSERFYAKRS